MEFQTKNGRIHMDNTDMDYVVFGKGSRNLILLPGLGDGLKTVRGMALPFSLLYWRYAKSY
ncbi:MAG: alpha/beta hydrolase, partial [Lachnospiraceae bacterium]